MTNANASHVRSAGSSTRTARSTKRNTVSAVGNPGLAPRVARTPAELAQQFANGPLIQEWAAKMAAMSIAGNRAFKETQAALAREAADRAADKAARKANGEFVY